MPLKIYKIQPLTPTPPSLLVGPLQQFHFDKTFRLDLNIYIHQYNYYILEYYIPVPEWILIIVQITFPINL